MSNLSPNNPKTGINSLRQYFNSRKMDSNNSKSPSQLSPYLKNLPAPQIISNNPFFESPNRQNNVTVKKRYKKNQYYETPTNYAPPKVNSIFTNQIKDSNNYALPNGHQNVIVSSPYNNKNHSRKKSRSKDYVVNNFVNINNLNIRNYYNEPNGTSQKIKSKY
jgi:hypothetical protein